MEEDRESPLPPPSSSSNNITEQKVHELNLDRSYEDFISEIDDVVYETEETVLTEVNAAILEDTRHLNSEIVRLSNTITKVLKDLSIQTDICRSKNSKFSKKVGILLMGTLIVSIVTILYETVYATILRSENVTINSDTKIVLDIFPAIFSALTAFFTGIIALKKYIPKMQEIGRIVQISMGIQSRIPSLKNRVQGCTSLEQFAKLELEYEAEQIQINSCIEKIGQAINLTDKVVHSEGIQYQKLRLLKSGAQYTVNSARINAMKDVQLAQISNMDAIDIESGTLDQIQVPDETWDEPSSTPTNTNCWSNLCPPK